MLTIIDVRDGGGGSAGGVSKLLARTASLEIRRLDLARDQEIPSHRASGEITVHCLEGRVDFTASGVTYRLSPGQLIVLPARVEHSLRALDDAAVLVTKILPGAAQPS